MASSEVADRRRRGALKFILGRPVAAIAVLWLAVAVIFAIGGSAFAPFSATQQDLSHTLAGPSAAHLLGTVNLGRDILSRLIVGARVTLLGVLFASVVALVLGGVFGLVAGYLRSIVDPAMSAVSDLLMSIPPLVVLLSVAAVTAKNTTVLMIVLGVVMSAPTFRIVRAATLEIRQELFITAARTSGLSSARILFRDVLPRLKGVLVIQASIVGSVALVVQVGLGFLGVDVTPPAPSWGNLLTSASQTIFTTSWPLVPPGVAIVLTVLAFSAIGDAAQRSQKGRRRHLGFAGKVRLSLLPDENGSGVSSRSSSVSGHATPDDAVLAVRELTVSIPSTNRDIRIVDGVSLYLKLGEIVGLVGESGAGKSVTARAILGMFPREAKVEGSILYQGTEIVGAPDATVSKLRGKEIAFVSQEPMVSLSPAFRIGHQIEELVRTHRGVNRREAKAIAGELLASVKIPDARAVAQLYPHQISGGMAQRILIALALAGEPKLLVADEPTTALDVSVQMQILELLRSLQQEQALAILLVTHDWGVVADICDRTVVMYAGEVVEESSTIDVLTMPRHPYSAALRAADPHSQTPGHRLLTLPGQVPVPGAWSEGCRFHDRCGYATKCCGEATVSLRTIERGRTVRCIRADDIGPL